MAKKTVKKSTEKTEQPKLSKFKVCLNLGSQSFEGDGETANEAVENLFKKEIKFKTFGKIFLVSDGKASLGFRMRPINLRMCKARQDYRNLLSKRIQVTF